MKHVFKKQHEVGSRLRGELVVGPLNSVLLSSKDVQRATCSGTKFAWGISGWTPTFSFTFIKKIFTEQVVASRVCRGFVVGPPNTVLLSSKDGHRVV